MAKQILFDDNARAKMRSERHDMNPELALVVDGTSGEELAVADRGLEGR